MGKTANFSHRIEFRATAEEYDLATQLAAEYNVTVSDLFRILLQQVAQEQPLSQSTSAHCRQLAVIYSRLSELHAELQRSKQCDEVTEWVSRARKIIIQIIQSC